MYTWKTLVTFVSGRVCFTRTFSRGVTRLECAPEWITITCCATFCSQVIVAEKPIAKYYNCALILTYYKNCILTLPCTFLSH